jgi:hypothetical protein
VSPVASSDVLAAVLGPGGAVVVLVELVRRDRATRRRDAEAKTAAVEAKSAAVEAADLARPTGNGFAGQVLASLARVERTQQQQAEMSGRTVARLDQVAGRLADHIDLHLRDLQAQDQQKREGV